MTAVRRLTALQRHRQRAAMGRAVLSVEVNFNDLSAALIDAGFLCGVIVMTGKARNEHFESAYFR